MIDITGIHHIQARIAQLQAQMRNRFIAGMFITVAHKYQILFLC